MIDTTQIDARQAARLIWDNLHEAVEIVPYSPDWAGQFEAERKKIAQALHERALRIEHIGSTAIPGLSAKPIIDILVSVANLDEATGCIASLAELGYTFVDYPDNTERLFFRKGFPRTHHIHLVEAGGREEYEKIRFRDALRASPALRAAYMALKKELSEAHRYDRARYSERKSKFVHDILGSR